jgi:hypothetical protein
MVWHLDVPKILHVYWGGSEMPYLRYLTVKSFMRLNPNWKVILWQPYYEAKKLATWKQDVQNYKVSCKNYLPELLKLDIEIRQVNFEDYGMSNTMSEVHKSDFLRFRFLHEIGGVYSDMDILYFRPITFLKVNIPKNKEVESYISICWYGNSNGFFLSAKGSEYFKKMASLSKANYKAGDYLSLGPALSNRYFPTIKTIPYSVLDFGMEAVYAHDCYQMIKSYNGGECLFTEYSIGCHWYAGTHEAGNFINTTNGGLTNLPDNLLGHLLKNINYEMPV